MICIKTGFYARMPSGLFIYAASNISYALESHQRWMDDWLLRFQEAMNSDQK